MRIGIYTVSSQSGRAFFADMIEKGHQVYGYARESSHGIEFVNTINKQKGIYLERPINKNNEKSKFISLGSNAVGHDVEYLVSQSDIIIISHPSHYLTQTIKQLKDAGIEKKRIPIILSPSRTFAVPYLWNILGEKYPLVCFSTCPYSCKAPNSGTAYIKRRKRNWLVSLEGEFTKFNIEILERLFPQALFNHIPATTSIGNIGAVFHPSTYLLNHDDIVDAERQGKSYSFYMEGIANNAKVANHLEEIDQVRLKIADYLGLTTFGYKENPNEEKWAHMMSILRNKELKYSSNIDKLRLIRHDCLKEISTSIVSAQHWLDYTYGVERIPGESLQSAISRTPTYQKMSVPQKRYVEEDVPTGLVPLFEIANRFGIEAKPIKDIIDLFFIYCKKDDKNDWRDLREFSTDFIYKYLKGEFFRIID